MILKVSTKQGNVYYTKAIEVINNNNDIRLLEFYEGDYVWIDCEQILTITLVEQ